MTQCTRYGKENVDVHTCTPLPTTPVGGTVEGDWIEKVQRDMGEMKFHCDSRYADWDTLMAEVRQSIEKHMPTPKSQEAVAGKKYSTGDIAHFVIDHKLQKRNAGAALGFFLEYNNMLAD